MLLALAAVWGGSFLFAEIALTALGPLSIALHRVGWGALILWGVAWAMGLRPPRAPRLWAAWLVMGALNNAIPFTLIFWGQQEIEAGLAAILNGTTAVFGAVVAGVLLRDEPLTRARLGGAALGLAGVAVILGPGVLAGLDPRDLAQLAVLAAALSYALASAWGKVALAGQPPVLNALGMLTGSTVLLLPLAVWAEGVPRLDLPVPVWGALAGLAGLSTALAYLLYFAILRRAGAANLMLVTLMIPPFAVGLGALVLGERLAPAAGLGFALIAAGLVLSDGRVSRHGAMPGAK
jgi:drug/metabolite transporter (DMT)-like permease